MQEQEKKMTELESFSIIQQMIQSAKEEHHENGSGWLIWGWLLFIASVTSVILAYMGARQYIGWVWTGSLGVGGIVYVLEHTLKPKNTVKTYVQDLLGKIETGFFVSLFIIVAAGMLSKASFAFGYYYILYAFWMFIHGSAIKFKPLIVGAFVNWAAAIAIFLIIDFKYDMMVSAIAVLVGYLVPGYMLRAEYKRKSLLSATTNHAV